MTKEVSWGEPPDTPHGGGWRKYTDFAAALRRRPGEWAKLPGGPHHRSMTSYVNAGKSASFGEGFEATSRKGGDIWIRYLGDDDVSL